MKRILTIILGCLLLTPVFAQEKAADFSTLLLIKMEAKEDYKPQEPQVLECSNYILLRAAKDNDNENLQIAFQFILKWMMGTPDYKFVIDEDATEIMKDQKLIPIFMASQVKAALENPEGALNESTLKLNGFKVFLNYCADKKNKVEQTKYLKKMIKANEKGTLEKELKLEF